MSWTMEICGARIQADIYTVSADETPTSVINISGTSAINNANGWIYAVNLIYRCLASNIWTTDAAIYMPSWMDYYGIKNNYDFCKKLSEYNPFVLDEINMRYWMEPLVCNTCFGDRFIEGFGLENLKCEVCPPFIDALDRLFRKRGVPWEAGDLFDMDMECQKKGLK